MGSKTCCSRAPQSSGKEGRFTFALCRGKKSREDWGLQPLPWNVAVNLLETVLVSFRTGGSKAVDPFVTRSKNWGIWSESSGS